MSEQEYQQYKELNQKIIQKLDEKAELDDRIEALEKANTLLDRRSDIRQLE
jgi:hypothetical protein